MELTNSQYKKSEVGLIPHDWNVQKLSAISMEIGDGIHTTPSYVNDSEFYFINGNNLDNGIIKCYDETKCVSKEEYELLKKNLNNNTILMSINGTIGNLAFFNNEKVVLGKSAAYINLKDKVDKKFIYFLLQHSSIKNYYENELTGTTIRNLSLKSIRDTPIPLPQTKDEQIAIATALSDVDTLIENLEKLVFKKQYLREILRQELMQGIIRLDGCSFEWIEKTFDDIICRFSTGLNPRDNFTLNSGGENYYVTIKNFSDGNLYLDAKCDIIDNQALLKINERSDLRKDDILLASIGRVGDVYFIKETPNNWNINESVFTLRANKNVIYPLYLYYIFKTNKIKRDLENKITGSTFKSIKMADLKAIRVRIPVSITEQVSISKILSLADFEVIQLQNKLFKYRMLRQGMMQTLLTGKIRLI